MRPYKSLSKLLITCGASWLVKEFDKVGFAQKILG